MVFDSLMNRLLCVGWWWWCGSDSTAADSVRRCGQRAGDGTIITKYTDAELDQNSNTGSGGEAAATRQPFKLSRFARGIVCVGGAKSILGVSGTLVPCSRSNYRLYN